jgi:hypothetical protein
MKLTLNTNQWPHASTDGVLRAIEKPQLTWGQHIVHSLGFGEYGYFTVVGRVEAAAQKQMQQLITPAILAGVKSIRNGEIPSNAQDIFLEQTRVWVIHQEKQANIKLVQKSLQSTLAYCIEELRDYARAIWSFISPDPIQQILKPYSSDQQDQFLSELRKLPPTAQTNSSPPTALSATAPASTAQTPRS